MHRPCTLALATLAVMLNGCTTAETTASAEPRWIDLFNGRDLDGWHIKVRGFPLGENHNNTFRVEDGVLKVVYDDYDGFEGEFGHLFYETPYSNYDLRIEYRFVGEQTPGAPGWAYRNSGVMLHSQSPDSMGLDQEFPVSIEAQMLGGNGEDDRPTGNVCTPGTNIVMAGELIRRHCTNSTSETYHGDGWVTLELQVRGHDSIRHLMDGEVVLEYQKPQLDDRDPEGMRLMVAGSMMLDGGYIALQAESHPVEFRRVQLLPLESKPR